MPKMQSQWWRMLFFGLLFVIGYKIIDNFPRILEYARKLVGILTPFIIGGILAFFLHKPVRYLRKKLERARLTFLQKAALPLSLGIVYLLFLCVCVFVIGYLVDAILQNVSEIIANWDSISARAIEIFEAVHIPQKQAWLDKANAFLSGLMKTEVLLKAGNIVGGVASSLASVFTGIIISIYAIIEKESLKAIFKKGSSLIFGQGRADKFRFYAYRLADMFYSYFTGLSIDAVVVGAISTLFYFLYDAPYPWLLGLVAGIGNLIPFFGPIISAVLITLVCLIAQGPMRALWVLIFQLVLGQLDGNLIQPRIIGKSVGISPFWVIFAVVFFGGIWGTAGMLLGVPLVAAVRMMLLAPAKAPQKMS